MDNYIDVIQKIGRICGTAECFYVETFRIIYCYKSHEFGVV